MTMFGNPDQSFKVFSAPDAITCKAVGPITGKRFVKLVAGGTFQQPKVSLCGAGEQAYGVAAYTVADGEVLTVQQISTWTVTAGVALVAPVQIESDATGKAVPLGTLAGGTGRRLGQVHQDAAINSDAAVRLAL
jgi:hypothetical protein